MSEFKRDFYPEEEVVECLGMRFTDERLREIAHSLMGDEPEKKFVHPNTKFHWVETPVQVLKLFMKGKSEVKVVAEIGITRSRFNEWKGQHNGFYDLVKYGQVLAQVFWEDASERNAQFELGNFQSIKYILQNRFREDHPKDSDQGDNGTEEAAKAFLKLFFGKGDDKKEDAKEESKENSEGGLSGLTQNGDAE